MPCYHPVSAWQTDGGEVVFVERGKIRRELTLPCGNCVGCRVERSRQWAVRCMHESQMHDSNLMLNLTYSDEYVPGDYSLKYSHFQLFMKRLRKWHYAKHLRNGLTRKEYKPLRFYMCGEYGELYSRPHYHAIIFGLALDDLVYHSKSQAGSDMYVSETLTNIWSLGHVTVGAVTYESAAYIARYCVKAVTDPGYEWILDPETGELYERPREFTRMSLKPGIGAKWYEIYKSEVYPHDRVIMNGIEMKPPRYYDRLLALEESFAAEELEYERYKMRMKLPNDSTVDRLKAREICAKAKLKLKKRSLE